MALKIRFKKHIVSFNLTRIKENISYVLGGLVMAVCVTIVPIMIAILFGGY